MSKNSCFRTWPIYCPILKLIKHIFCLSVIFNYYHLLYTHGLFISWLMKLSHVIGHFSMVALHGYTDMV